MARIIVSTERGEMNAQITKGFLQNAGIPASVGVESSGNHGSVAGGSVFDIYVEEKDFTEAKTLLKERDNINVNEE